jgi:hypothetical protein
MKVRIKGNSVRIRLSRSEVEIFGREGYVEERTDFGKTELIYAVKSTDDEMMSATFTGGMITMCVPANMLNVWAETNQVSLDHHMPVSNNKHLYLLLEKDFKCIDAGGTEDQSDYYENPLKSC